MNATLEEALKSGLSALGLYDRSRNVPYAAGAAVPDHIPVPRIPRPVPVTGPLSSAALDAAADEALAPRASGQSATPAGYEPGLMEDLVGLALTPENVEAVLDELVRPALNADGGDITLVAIEGSDVHVRLVGACNTCPSSVMTMKMGVERLLQEEFPDMGDLIQVDGPSDW